MPKIRESTPPELSLVNCLIRELENAHARYAAFESTYVTQPAADHWGPLEYSDRLRLLRKVVNIEIEVLQHIRARHWPVGRTGSLARHLSLTTDELFAAVAHLFKYRAGELQYTQRAVHFLEDVYQYGVNTSPQGLREQMLGAQHRPIRWK